MLTSTVQHKPHSDEFKDLVKSGTFLIVDDNSSLRRTIIDQLRRLGIQKLVEAENGAEAFRIIKHQPVSFVLSDWNMPVMDGLQLLRAIRADADNFHLPVLMITAEAARNKIELAITSGVTDLLVKPFSGALLEERIERALHWSPKKLNNGMPLNFTDQNHAPENNNDLFDESLEPTKSTILIADNDPESRSLVSDIFKEDYIVNTAENGKAILEICQSDNPPDLILMEAILPDMDGFAVAEKLRANSSSENIPVIFITSRFDDESRVKGLSLGALYFMEKPVNPDIVRGRVTNMMGYIHLNKRLQRSYDQMQEIARLRDEVDHITRHDLKSPLLEVLSISQELLKNNNLSKSENSQIETIKKSINAALNMLTMSSEIFKIERGVFTLKPERVNVLKMIKELLEEYKEIYAENNLSVQINQTENSETEDYEINGDTTMCYSAFHNLLKNAFEAAPKKTSIKVQLTKNESIEISIENTGTVPIKIRERFFDKFSTFGKENGNGIGTYSAKLLLEAQGATIQMLTSDEDNRTVITTRFPL